MGGELEYNPYEPKVRQNDTAATDANATADSGRLQAEGYERAQYQPGQVEKPYGNGNGTGRATYGGDVQQTYNPGVQNQNPRVANGNGEWRSRYGGDVGTTFNPGQQRQEQQGQQQQGGWRKPYGADSPLVTQPAQPVERPVVQPGANGNQGEVDPLTGQPLRRRPEQQIDPATGQPVPPRREQPRQADGTTTPLTAQQQDIANKRRIVDQALDYNTVGYGGNLLAGGVGGMIGRHTIPWAMDKLSATVTLDKDAAPKTFREKVVRYWQDNHDPKTWNRTELNFARTTIDGENGLTSRMSELGKGTTADLARHNARAKLLDPFTDASVTGNKTSIYEARKAAVLSQRSAQKSGLERLFSADELKSMREAQKTGTVQKGLVAAFEDNALAQQAVKTRAETFKFLGDPSNPISAKSDALPSRLRTVTDALDNKPLFKPNEIAAMEEFKAAASTVSKGAGDATALGRVKAVAGKYGSSFLQGAGVAGTVMIADHYADKFFFGNNHGNGVGDSINSVLVPLAFMGGPKKMLPMIATGVGAMIVGKTIGSSLQEGENPKYGRLFRQSTAESGILAAEALLPLKGGKGINLRTAGLMAATWGAFRLKNAILDPAPPSETKDRAFELLGDDAKRRTEGSMTSAIDKFGELGKGDESTGLMAWTNAFKEGQGKTKGARGEAALNVYRTEWLTKPTNQFGSMLEANRGAAILTTAFAESRLGHGTHVPTITDTPTYLLPGQNLDLGGKAARDFIIGRINIESAKKEVQNNLGKEIAGKKVDQSEIAELDEVKKRIEASEAKIYGQHDMSGAVKELAEWGKGLNATHMAKIEVDLRNTIAANQNSSDARYKAKLFRDLATVYLSSAYNKQDGDPQTAAKLLGGDTNTGRQALDMTGQPRGYDGAFNCIQMAKQLDPNNPDIAQLEQIAQQINSKLPAGIQRQMNDGKYNPLQIRQ